MGSQISQLNGEEMAKVFYSCVNQVSNVLTAPEWNFLKVAGRHDHSFVYSVYMFTFKIKIPMYLWR